MLYERSYNQKHSRNFNELRYFCFITSNKWMRTAYGKKLRDYFIEHTQPIQLLDMGPGVFDAAVDTNILLLQNAASDDRPAFTATTILEI